MQVKMLFGVSPSSEIPAAEQREQSSSAPATRRGGGRRCGARATLGEGMGKTSPLKVFNLLLKALQQSV